MKVRLIPEVADLGANLIVWGSAPMATSVTPTPTYSRLYTGLTPQPATSTESGPYYTPQTTVTVAPAPAPSVSPTTTTTTTKTTYTYSIPAGPVSLPTPVPSPQPVVYYQEPVRSRSSSLPPPPDDAPPPRKEERPRDPEAPSQDLPARRDEPQSVFVTKESFSWLGYGLAAVGILAVFVLWNRKREEKR